MQTALNMTQQEVGDLHRLIDRALVNVKQIDDALDSHPYGGAVLPVVDSLRSKLQVMRQQLLAGAVVDGLDKWTQAKPDLFRAELQRLTAPLHDAHVQAYRDHLAGR